MILLSPFDVGLGYCLTWLREGAIGLNSHYPRNRTMLVKKVLLTSLLIGGSTLMVDMQFSPAKAANFYFVPAGSQLDNDSILDIVVSPGQEIAFDVFLDTRGVSSPLTLNSFWNFTYDTGELSFIGTEDGPGILNSVVPLGSNQFDVASVLILDNTINKLLTVNFLVTNPGRSPHDGVVDFGITLTSVTGIGGSPDFTNSFPSPSKNGLNLPGTEFNQVVEVQTTEPSTILSLLALGTLGAASTLKRKLKSSKSTEKEKTKVS
jgi:hypothetical protein